MPDNSFLDESNHTVLDDDDVLAATIVLRSLKTAHIRTLHNGSP